MLHQMEHVTIMSRKTNLLVKILEDISPLVEKLMPLFVTFALCFKIRVTLLTFILPHLFTCVSLISL